MERLRSHTIGCVQIVTWWVGQVKWWASDMVDMVSVVTWWVFIRAKDRAGE